MTTTYCTRTDLEAIISPAGLLACIDDDENGGTSPTADGYVTSAIENAASKINQKLATSKYKPASIGSNAWVKWTNAYLAIDILSRRRNNPAVESITSEIKERLELLDADSRRPRAVARTDARLRLSASGEQSQAGTLQVPESDPRQRE
jgi:hypothetical protein